MTFGEAFEQVKKGKGMRLPHWKPDVVIKAQYPDENSKMTAPYLYVESRFGRVPWKETMIELFSEDWEVIVDCEEYCCPEERLLRWLSESIDTLVGRMSREYLEGLAGNALFELIATTIVEETESPAYQFSFHLLDSLDPEGKIRVLLSNLELPIKSEDHDISDCLASELRGLVNDLIDALNRS